VGLAGGTLYDRGFKIMNEEANHIDGLSAASVSFLVIYILASLAYMWMGLQMVHDQPNGGGTEFIIGLNRAGYWPDYSRYMARPINVANDIHAGLEKTADQTRLLAAIANSASERTV
jgi:hypothetical protein